MKFYISGPRDGGDGVYTLLHESGERLASHYCSHRAFASGDLILHRPERQERWAKEFGLLDPIEVVWLGDCSQEEVAEVERKNRECHERWLEAPIVAQYARQMKEKLDSETQRADALQAEVKRLDDIVQRKPLHHFAPLADGHNCVFCHESSIWKCDADAHTETMPRWENDKTVQANGWNTPDRCANCGEVNPYVRQEVTDAPVIVPPIDFGSGDR